MAEEPGEPSDGMTQPSREKSRWQKFKSWLSDFLGPCMVWSVGGTLGLLLFLLCLLAAMAVAWPIVKAVRAGKGFPSYDIIYIGGLVISGMSFACLCGYCGRNIVRLIQSSSGRVAVCLKNPLCWASVMIAASCGSVYSMLSLSSFPWPWIGWVLLLCLCVFVLSVVLRLLWRPAKEWMGKLPLFVAIAIWVVLAAALLAVLVKWWGGWPTTSPASGTGVGGATKAGAGTNQNNGAFEAVKSALTAVAGIGGVAYLVIKYRTEQRETAGIADKKISAAVDQLGSDKASTRIAGVYALTDIADRYKGGYRQRVVDILCGYLRSDRANYALDELGQPVKNASGHLVKSGASDEAVESTILSVMRDRLRKERKDETGETIVRQTVDDDQLWCDCEFDLHGATFHEAVDLTDSTFECVPCFRGTKFERNADFRGAHFAGDADFRGARFAGGADFRGARFTRGADFRGTHFARGVYFGRARFAGGADFRGARFTRGAYFRGARFAGYTDFRGARFAGGAYFGRATFAGYTDFRGTRFAGGADFEGARFAGGADFEGATFAGGAYFGRATFAGNAYFGRATFTRGADFRWARFAGGADFYGADFTGGAYFYGADFTGGAYFGRARFAGGADFRGARFAGGADFRGARFAGGADFRGATFAGDAHFDGARFAGGADFRWATFAGGADFGWAEFRASAAFSEIQGQPSFGFEACKFNRKFRGTDAYRWGPIPTGNDGLPAGAVWADFPEEDDKDGGTTSR